MYSKMLVPIFHTFGWAWFHASLRKYTSLVQLAPPTVGLAENSGTESVQYE